MIERIHGIDRHKQFSTISVLNPWIAMHENNAQGVLADNGVELLIRSKGLTPLIRPAFLADVAHIRRLLTLRKTCACLGLASRADSCGGPG